MKYGANMKYKINISMEILVNSLENANKNLS